ncbi:MAG TPA: hypothetical protein VHQ46_00660 [Desulfobacteria bacterium]|nr:hypothetical protein [Desulfobacteria bacterium]
MRRTVIGVYKSLAQAKNTIEAIRVDDLANNGVSVVVLSRTLSSGNYKTEFAQELTRLPAEKMMGIFDGYLVQSGPIELPDLGEIMAAGPFARALLQERDQGLSGNLANFGITAEEAREYEAEVREGNILLIAEAESDHANAIANRMAGNGAQQITKWSRSTNRPMHYQK